MLQFDGTVKISKGAEKADFSPPSLPHPGLTPSLFSCIITNAHLILKRAETAGNIA